MYQLYENKSERNLYQTKKRPEVLKLSLKSVPITDRKDDAYYTN